jgi:hypothetical protein
MTNSLSADINVRLFDFNFSRRTYCIPLHLRRLKTTLSIGFNLKEVAFFGLKNGIGYYN